MRAALAAVVGALVGTFGGSAAAAALTPFLLSSSRALSWELTAAVDAVPWVPASALTVIGAFTLALAAPALLAAIGEVPFAGKSARTSAVFLVCATGVIGLATPGGPAVAYLVGGLLLAALFALAPRWWAAVPVALLLGATAAFWVRDIVEGAQFLRPAAQVLAHVTHSSVGVWTVALAVPSVGLLVLGVALVVRGVHRSGR